MSRNYFKDLSLGLEATANDVREAYKKLAKQWHPDKNKENGAEDKFKDILAAYTHLRSDDRRETHAREIKRQQETAKSPKPPPQPPPQPKPSTTSEHSKETHKPDKSRRSSSTEDSSKSKTSQNDSSQKSDQKYWWDSFRSNTPSASNKTNTSGSTNKTNTPGSRKGSAQAKSTGRRPKSRVYFFMDSFMDFTDPFDNLLFDTFMIPPSRPPPKPKQKTDPFGNKLPKNVEGDIYDWKSATKPSGQMPDYQEYLDGDTEFACHYCGMMMDMDMLRKHEPRCLRLGGKKVNNEYQFTDEDINAAHSTSSTRPKSVRKIKCRWCDESFSKSVAAAHIALCKQQASNDLPKRPKGTQARPEWNNNFTESEYNDMTESVFESRPRSARIDIGDFNPFTSSARSTCLQCKVKYGLAAPNYCTH